MIKLLLLCVIPIAILIFITGSTYLAHTPSIASVDMVQVTITSPLSLQRVPIDGFTIDWDIGRHCRRE